MTSVQLSEEQFQTLLGRLSTGNANANANGGGAAAVSSQTVKAVRPSIDLDMTESEWEVFVDDQWARFKRMAKLTVVSEIRDNLRACCSIQLNKRLFDVKGVSLLNAASEEDLLSWIKAIAVKRLYK